MSSPPRKKQRLDIEERRRQIKQELDEPLALTIPQLRNNAPPTTSDELAFGPPLQPHPLPPESNPPSTTNPTKTHSSTPSPPPSPSPLQQTNFLHLAPPPKEKSQRVLDSIHAPVPFNSARKEKLHNFRVGVSTNLTVPSKLNLAIIMAERMGARDWKGAAAAIPALISRFRQVDHHRWYFAREIMTAGTEILRRCQTSNPTKDTTILLYQFLETIMRSDGVGLGSAPGYGLLVRETALLELIVTMVYNNQINTALEILREETKKEPFASSTLVQGYYGFLSLLQFQEVDAPELLNEACDAFLIASEKDKDAYCFVHYTAACAYRNGDTEKAKSLLRQYLEKHDRNPFAISTLLQLLKEEYVETPSAVEIAMEMVYFARHLIGIDPFSDLALDVFKQVQESQPGELVVSNLELARVYAARIECGMERVIDAWTCLLNCLKCLSKDEMIQFWEKDERDQWWPRSYFRSESAHADLMASPALADVKRATSLLLGTDNSYVESLEKCQTAVNNKVHQNE